MCEPASFVLTRDRVFWSMNTDSHENIIKEFGLHQDGVQGVNILRVEITPPGGDFAKPAAEWRYKLDQDLLPEWHDGETDEARTRAALLEWINKRVIREGAKKVASGKFWACDSSKVTAYGSSEVTACDSSKVTAYGSSEVTAYGSSKVTACDSSKVTAYGSSEVTAYGSSKVTACDSSKVTAYGSSEVTAYGSSKVTAYGSSKVTAYGSSEVTAYGSSKVTACKDHATVRQYGGTVADPTGPHAVVIDSRGGKSVCKVGEAAKEPQP